jgi:hypothetical protein
MERPKMKINSFNKLFIGCACVFVSGAIYSAVETSTILKDNHLKSVKYIKTVESQNASHGNSENTCYLALHLDMIGVPFVQESGKSNKAESGTCGTNTKQKGIES